MKCYCHPDVDALAICKSCCRALCRDCVTEVGLSCSCRGRCEADVATLNDLVERSRTAYQKNGAMTARAAIFVTLMGTLFTVLGVADVVGGVASEWSYAQVLMGILFGGWGVSLFASAKRMTQK